MGDRIALGRWGEDLAAAHLAAHGYEVLARNWRCRYGELDIVARTPEALVFVEVKTRSGPAYGPPAEAVTRVKASRIRLLAAQWLSEARPRGWSDLRFDVISVVRRRDEGPELVHLRGAF